MTQQRFEIYRPIHKAVRHILFSTASDLGSFDLGDDDSTTHALDGLAKTVALLQEHAAHETNFVHPKLEEKAPGVIALFAGNHEDDEKVYTELGRLAGEIRSADGNQRVQLRNELYARYNRFLGEYLGHLDREEQVLEKALWDHFTDEELMGINTAIEHSVSPAAMEGYLSAMCASFSPDELTKILGGMKAFAPPEVTEWALGIAKQAAPPAVWAKVSAALA